MTDHESVEALKRSVRYRALGVLGRERLLWATFPEIRERHEAESAEHLAAAAYGQPTNPHPEGGK